MLTVILALFLAAWSVGPAHATDLDLKEGLWEITLTLEMPRAPMPPQKFTQCLTRENAIPRPPQEMHDCSPRKIQVQGNKVVWEWDCRTGEGPVSLAGEIVYQGEKMNGWLKVRQGGLEVKQRLSGVWLDKCP